MPSLGLGLNLYKTQTAVYSGLKLDAQAVAHYDRVIADGGTFEAYNCLVGDINELLALNQIATTFNLRVLADSGTFEQINCLQTTITDLQNININ